MTGYRGSFNTTATLMVSGVLLGLWVSQAAAQVVADDVVCAGCVQATDIANGTIGPNKLIPGSITATTIANGSIGPNKLIPGSINATTIANGSIGPNKLIPGSINTATIAVNAITSNKILDGAVHSADIADGAVTFAKLGPDAVFMRTIVVSPVGTPSQNGSELLAALAGITDNSASNPWLIHIEPGLYDVGAERVIVKEFVDLEGSGEGATRIRGTNSVGYGVVNTFAGNAEIRSLSVENTGGGNIALAIRAAGSAVKISHVTAVAQDGVIEAVAIAIFGTANLTNVKATAINPGVRTVAAGVVVFGNAELVNVKAIGTDASVLNAGLSVESSANATARNSVLVGGTDVGASGVARLIATQVDGGISGAGSFNCVGAYDGAFAPLNASCL